jgi:UDP-N-acetyl-D-galactosamine dehydrogenase
VPDTRNSRVVDIIAELAAFGVAVEVCDPLADPAQARHEYGVELTPLEALAPADAVILAVPHRAFVAGGWALVRRLMRPGSGAVLDLRGALDRDAVPMDYTLWRL